MNYICHAFPVTHEDYKELDKKFNLLCEYAAHQLIRKNSRNNHTDEQIDVAQELRIALIRAGSYYKRQVYIENCLELCKKYVTDKFMRLVLEELCYLWENKTRHGANRQKYGLPQEKILDRLVEQYVPIDERPCKKEPLRLDTKFETYCKAITWNAQKSMGKKITKDKSFRGNMISLSEFDYLGGNSMI